MTNTTYCSGCLKRHDPIDCPHKDRGPYNVCRHCGVTFELSYGPRICMDCDDYFECRRGHSFCVRH